MIYNAGGFKTAYGSFSVRARSPASSSILYTLADTEGNRTTVEVPFIARKPVGTIFADMDSYYQNVCAPASSKAAAAAVITTSTTTSSASTTELPATTTAVEVKQQTSFAPSTNPDKPSSPGNFNSVLQQVQLVPGQDFDTKTRAMVIHNDNDRYSFDINSPLFSSPVDAVYQIDEETAVIKIGSFSANENATLSHWVESLEHLRTNASVKKVIFDVTDNGGGYICLGNALARYLFPDSDAHASDFLASPFYERMADAMINNTDSLFNWEGVKIASTGELASNDSWMHDKISYVKGGLVSNYTQKISLDCSYLYQTLPKMETPPWPAENLAIVSNGYCGSTW